MSWSLGETQALAVKAARGSGFSWGLAEEAGFAARWLQAHGLPGAAALAGYLARREENGGTPAGTCPLLSGSGILDRPALLLHDPCPELGAVAFPLLLLPFVAEAAAAAKLPEALLLEWTGAVFQITRHELAFKAEESALLTAQADCRLSPGRAKHVMSFAPATRVPDSAASDVERLEGFAARTYAPATEQSRLSGAGAGTGDND